VAGGRPAVGHHPDAHDVRAHRRAGGYAEANFPQAVTHWALIEAAVTPDAALDTGSA